MRPLPPRRIQADDPVEAFDCGVEQLDRWLARNAPDPVPVILLGRLAIDSTAQGQGLGHQLLAHAMRTTAGVAAIVGARALVVEAINDAAVSFYLHEGFRPSARRADLLYAPLR